MSDRPDPTDITATLLWARNRLAFIAANGEEANAVRAAKALLDNAQQCLDKAHGDDRPNDAELTRQLSAQLRVVK